MESVLTGVGIVSTAVLRGGMIFFSVCMAPLIFITLDADIAGRFIVWINAVQIVALVVILVHLTPRAMG